MGQLMKCDAIYQTPFWRAAGLNGFGISDHGAARAVFDNTPADRRPGRAAGLRRRLDLAAPTARMTKDQRRAAVLQGFAEMFGEQALHPIDYVEHDWTKERWTRGGPTAIHGPGHAGPPTARPYAARSAGCTGPAPRPRRTGRGYMDGAVSSGQRAAAEVLAKLR